MVSHLFFYQWVLLGLLWLCVRLPYAWPNAYAGGEQRPSQPLPPPRQRSRDPQPFPGLTRTPPCAACAQAHASAPQPPGCPPPRIVSTRGRPRQVDTSFHCCPKANCDDGGGVGLGHSSAHGPPNGGPWRQLHGTSWGGSFQATHGTPVPGTRGALDWLVWAVGALAEGLGSRAVARGFAVDPQTVLHWVVEVADHAMAFSRYVVHDVRVTQVQLDELLALLRAVQDGEVSEAEAVPRLSRAPHWGWAAIAPESQLLLALHIGARPLAMAPRLVPQVVEVLAPGGVPLFLTDGFKEYTPARLTQCGPWVQPERRQATGPAPQPRWLPRPHLL